jgi:hypothetical protein
LRLDGFHIFLSAIAERKKGHITKGERIEKTIDSQASKFR